MSVNKLKGKIIEKGVDIEDLADAIEVSTGSMYRKLRNFDRLTISEAVKIKEVLNLTDAETYEIFLE